MNGRLSGKTALVTGGSRGFGRATALRLAREGADVAIVYRQDSAAADDVVSELRDAGRRSLAIRADLAHEDEARGAVNQAEEALGSLDILVNNAGIRHIAPFQDQTTEAWRDMLDVNVWGPMFVMHEALGGMIKRGGGSIVNVSSQMAHIGWARFAVYTATKAYLIALTRSVAADVGASNVRVNAVCPGSIVTDMNRENTPPAVATQIASETPLGRLGSADDVAAAVAYLASDDASFVTGQWFDVNGGRVMA